MWFASALLSGEQTVVSTSYGSTKPWLSAFVTLSITLSMVSKASFWAFTVLFFAPVTGRQTVARTATLNASTAARSKSLRSILQRSNKRDACFAILPAVISIKH